ncbi:hypothetical protein [sulfur-oxidizing endosymbiont of Gigantopelta aegis]|uniref:hypothetical protein n=1 Tax=sulfur-oxidizing endosymbiont of Gigantopelta aegis TaxID=2794934 RepID=UPI001BE42FA4|nr:hypothetical protein [sulfur-oxidizing endosymbiont of Gigantopelta aegis]
MDKQYNSSRLLQNLIENGLSFSVKGKNQIEKEENIFRAVAYSKGKNFFKASPLAPILKKIKLHGIVKAGTGIEDKEIQSILDEAMEICDILDVNDSL